MDDGAGCAFIALVIIVLVMLANGAPWWAWALLLAVFMF